MIQSAASMGILVTARKWPRIVEPTMSMSTMQAVRRDSWMDLTNPFQVRSFLRTDKRRTANVPTLPASVGVKKPFISPPIDQEKNDSDPQHLRQGGQPLLPGGLLTFGAQGRVDPAPHVDDQPKRKRRSSGRE